MEKNSSEGFVFLNSFYEAINEIDDKQVRDEITSAIITFGITENVDFEQLSPVARFGMKIIISIIEKQKAKYRNKKAVGSLGGRPKKSDSEKPNENQECNSKKTNENLTAQNNPENKNQNCKTEKPNININNNTNINIKKENENKKEIVCLKETANETQTQKEKIFNWFLKETKKEQSAESLTASFIKFNQTEYQKDITLGDSWQNHIASWFQREKKKQQTLPQVAHVPPQKKRTPLPGVSYPIAEIRANKWGEEQFDPATETIDPYGRKCYQLKKSA